MRAKIILRGFFIWLLFLLVQNSAFAVLNLELTRGVDSAIPIAVVPFKVQGTATLPVDVSQIIADDLGNSGQFKLLDKADIKQFPTQLNEVDFDYWQKLHVNAVAFGLVEAIGNDRYRVTVTLVDVYKGKFKRFSSLTDGILQGAATNPVLARQTYMVKKQDLRRLAHKISDVIYTKLTGISGIFSTKIAYVVVKRQKGQPTQYSLEIADADGYNPRAILISDQPIMSPSWSPDGKKVAYVSFEKRRVGLYIADVATGKRRLITQFPGINGAPSWSPDGKKMALVLSKKGNPKIYILDFKTNQLKQLSKGWAVDTEPSWSPDGQSIIFTSDRGGSPQIYQIDLATKKVKRLTFDGSYNASASFTPDGKAIVMLHRERDLFGIARQNLATGNVFMLTGAWNDQSPSVAPNGTKVIFASNYGNNGTLGVVSIDGRVQLKLPESNGEVSEPAWGPF